MPIYEYMCETCGDRVEVLQRLSDPPPGDCARDSGTMVRVLSAHNVGSDNGPGLSAAAAPQAMSCGTCGKPGSGCS